MRWDEVVQGRYVTPGQVGSAAFDVNVGDVEIEGNCISYTELHRVLFRDPFLIIVREADTE